MNEQQGVSPASADGAPALGPWDVGHSSATGGRNLYVRSADGDVYVGVIFEPADARRIVQLMNAEWRADFAVEADPRDVEIERLTRALRATEGRADAEIAQLRTALAGYQKRLGDDLLCGGKLVERVRAALRIDDGGTCTRASMDGVVGDVGRLCDEVERLRGELEQVRPTGYWKELAERRGRQLDQRDRDERALITERDGKRRELADVTAERDSWQARYGQLIYGALRVQQHLQRAHGQPETAVTSEYMGPDFSRSMVDGLRIDKDKADAEVTRLRERLGIPSETALRDLANRLHAIVDEEDCVRESVDEDHVVELITNVDNMLERAGADAARAIQKCLEVEAERDRLRQELSSTAWELVTAEANRNTMSNAIDEVRDILGGIEEIPAPTATPPAEPSRQGCPCKSQCDYLDGEGRCSDSCDCAAGRRWVAGDAEPEVGTTVRTPQGRTYTRRQAGNDWHFNDLCLKSDIEECGEYGCTWGVLLREYGELVEVPADEEVPF